MYAGESGGLCDWKRKRYVEVKSQGERNHSAPFTAILETHATQKEDQEEDSILSYDSAAMVSSHAGRRRESGWRRSRRSGRSTWNRRLRPSKRATLARVSPPLSSLFELCVHVPQTVPHPPDQPERAPVRQPRRDRVEHLCLRPVCEGLGQPGEVLETWRVDPDDVGV